ncbi:STAS/SEC14 domain-containing protein [Sphingomonas abietis]|uniref:STAS/SEC14 domain-containing protein n=1 Tax=Sphingomonas abietis TaxID=3012344 RepID=A0ABY7NT98_9SPHN|nr:STAS/SEC14 domain-containing protein [Sphingomonas abietis]WBO24030.1 STAS/SEC14 domain-containing protein [Sphingomonas abietis]
MYSIRYIPEQMLLDIRWYDRFSDEEVVDYALAVKREFLRHHIRTGYLLRIDMSASGAQPDEALPVFRENFQWFPKARRIAIIVADGETRQQVQGEMRQSYLRIFDDAEAGLTWLLESEIEFVADDDAGGPIDPAAG